MSTVNMTPDLIAQHQAAILREPAHGAHYRREFGDGPATEVIAVGEAAGKDDGVHIPEAGGIVPNVLRLLAQVVAGGVECVVIAIAAGKDNNAEFHGQCSWGEAKGHFNRWAGRPRSR